MPAAAVLVVDDDPGVREFVALALQDTGYRVLTAGDGSQALSLIGAERPALVLLDRGLPLLDGDALVAQIAELYGVSVPCIIMSGGDCSPLPAEPAAVCGYLAKPFGLDDLLKFVERYAGVPSLPPL